MSQLILVLRDLYPARLSDAARASLPRLPRLEQWLTRGDFKAGSDDWRQYLQRHMSETAAREAPPASVAAAAVPGVPRDLPVWFATPVHLVAGLDTVRLHPTGLLEVSEEAQHLLVRDFARVFTGSGWSLHATGRREMLLAGGVAFGPGALRSHDPALWLGADPRRGLPAGPGASALARLGAEIEMWLHEHPVNQARQERALLTVTGLWIWGGGERKIEARPGTVTQPAVAAVAWADDLFVDGLATLTGCTLAALPPCWPASAGMKSTPDTDRLVVCELRTEPGEHTLEMLERRWIAPALEHWRAGAWHSATLLAGACAVTLKRGALRWRWRGVRRNRPWWESMPQC